MQLILVGASEYFYKPPPKKSYENNQPIFTAAYSVAAVYGRRTSSAG